MQAQSPRRQHDEVVFEVDADAAPAEDALELYLHPDIPAASLVLVRPRLLPW